MALLCDNFPSLYFTFFGVAIGGLFWKETSGGFFCDLGKLIVAFFTKVLIQIYSFVCFVIQPAVLLTSLRYGAGLLGLASEKCFELPIVIWWSLLCFWSGLYFSMRRKNPESKWEWDIACGIVFFLLMPCSIIGYMIYRGIF